MAMTPSAPISVFIKLSKQANQCQIVRVTRAIKTRKGLGTTGSLLELLERCVGLEAFSDGFAALVADLGLSQPVETGELV